MKRIIGHIIEALFTVSGAITSIVILLIIVFLFKEGFGLFSSPAVEKGYSLYTNSQNVVSELNAFEITHIFDEKIQNWNELGGVDAKIETFRFDELFKLFPDDNLEKNRELIPIRLAEIIKANPNIVAFLPQKFAPKNIAGIKELPTRNISISDFFGGKE